MLTSAKISAFHADLLAAVETASKKHGISAKQVGKLMYNPELGTAKINLMFAEAATAGAGIEQTAKYV